MNVVYIAPSATKSVRVWPSAEAMGRLPALGAAVKWQRTHGNVVPPRIACDALRGDDDATAILTAYVCGLTVHVGTDDDLDRCPVAVARAIYAAKYLGADVGPWAVRLVDRVCEVSTPRSAPFDAIRLELLGRNGCRNGVLLGLCRRVLENAGWYRLVREHTCQCRQAGATGQIVTMSDAEVDRVRDAVVAAVAAHDGPLLGVAFKTAAIRLDIWRYVWHWFAASPSCP